MRTDLHIERLVLYGVSESDGPAVAAALRERLAELVVADSPQWTDVGRLDAGEFQPGGSPGLTGANIAVSVHKGLSRGRKS